MDQRGIGEHTSFFLAETFYGSAGTGEQTKYVSAGAGEKKKEQNMDQRELENRTHHWLKLSAKKEEKYP